jgi:hypothetical protein
MNKRELKKQLNKLGINKGYYSLNGLEFPDCTILSKNSEGWDVFYVDDRGNRTSENHFIKEEDAYTYLLKILKEEKELQDRIDKGYFKD